MADNLFGKPVTDATVKFYYPHKKVITAKDRAQVAFQLKEADEKSVNADKYVENLKERYGNGIATLVTIYNATGGTLVRYKDYDFHGHIGEVPYPNEIQNGQWAAFLHVHTAWTLRGSSAAIVYSGSNNAGDKVAWLNAWSNPHHGTNYAYTEVRPTSHYDTGGVWDAVESLFKTDNFSDNSNGGYTIASIGQNSPYKYVGTMTLDGVIDSSASN
ncbi:23 kDa jasmonate-induced protein [Ziziphus jujuba]|uniref:23 kDa jasmonate-induced protein n=2 Tax=Ziziphus jujuba TaxID=326968 RepID=A0ABM3IE18_ZIZJJ|nr:23 kDa jasmonate-induced protein-like [Ziziphus jujuba var. spinosa]XP_048326402.2 23 kDa jasmonate-induced protein [Ziziphus jujuba]KAH7536690.1 hypothetical protein FEM48_Zijuj03G0013200 [Ziziphus jujuba var. spinosa]